MHSSNGIFGGDVGMLLNTTVAVASPRQDTCVVATQFIGLVQPYNSLVPSGVLRLDRALEHVVLIDVGT